MALRAKESDVRDVVDIDSTINLLPFLRAANRLVDFVVTKDTSSLLSAGLLRDIETYLAAHFAVHNRDHQYNSKSTGGASGSFTGQFAMRLEGTSPGQTAMLLDVTGTLTALSQQGGYPTVGVSWLGKRPSEQTNYVDRD